MNDFLHHSDHSAFVVPADMTCRDVAQFLMAYTEGELAPAAKSSFDAHLAQCSSCVRYVQHYRRTVAMAQASGQSAEELAVPPGVLRAIREARTHVA
jgi:anti-sigma factor RsiW